MDKYQNWLIKKCKNDGNPDRLFNSLIKFMNEDNKKIAKRKKISEKEVRKRKSFIKKCLDSI